MKNFLPTFAAILVLAVSVFSQGIKPSPTPPDDGDVVRISTSLIQVDVTVTDKKGNAIRDLKPEWMRRFLRDVELPDFCLL